MLTKYSATGIVTMAMAMPMKSMYTPDLIIFVMGDVTAGINDGVGWRRDGEHEAQRGRERHVYCHWHWFEPSREGCSDGKRTSHVIRTGVRDQL